MTHNGPRDEKLKGSHKNFNGVWVLTEAWSGVESVRENRSARISTSSGGEAMDYNGV
jgi:hypothetical protein